MSSFMDKARDKADELTGAAKERIGEATHNERLRAEGARQESEARAREAGEAGRKPREDVRAPFTR